MYQNYFNHTSSAQSGFVQVMRNKQYSKSDYYYQLHPTKYYAGVLKFITVILIADTSRGPFLCTVSNQRGPTATVSWNLALVKPVNLV